MSVTRYNKKLKINEMQTIKEIEEPSICNLKIEKLLVPTEIKTEIKTNPDKSEIVDFPKERRNALIISDNEINEIVNEIVNYIKK